MKKTVPGRETKTMHGYWAKHSFTPDDPYPPYPIGWKAKVGVLLPAVDTGWGTFDFRRLSPDGVVTLETRVPMGRITLENLQTMEKGAVDAAKLLACAEPDVITYEGTAAGFILGVDGDAALCDQMTTATGIPSTSGAASVAESLKSLEAVKISIFAATPEYLTDYTVKYMTDKGFDVAGVESACFGHVTEGNLWAPQYLYERVKKFHKSTPGVDAIFIAGGAFRTLEIIPQMEKDFGADVVTTVPANMWNCLKIADYKDPIPGYGRLLDRTR